MTYIGGIWRVIRIGIIIVFAHIVQTRQVGTSVEVLGRTKITFSIKPNLTLNEGVYIGGTILKELVWVTVFALKNDDSDVDGA